MNKISLFFAAVALALAPVSVPTAVAAPSGSVVCEAQSPSAVGVGNAWTRATACNRALYECAIRTPANEVCGVTRWWFIV